MVARRWPWCRASNPTSSFSISACPRWTASRRPRRSPARPTWSSSPPTTNTPISAFDHGAIDYLLKPVEPERVALTCRRLRERLQQKPDPMNDLLEQLSQRLGSGGLKPREYMRWVQASVGANIRMIPTSDILFFRAEDKYTRVQTAGFEALIRKPIKELIEALDPNEFWQIHRATVVRVDAVAQVSRNFRGNQIVHVKGRDEKLEVSRSFNHLFKQM